MFALNGCREEFMRLALAQAQAAFQEGEGPVGCVIVDGEGKILARAHNRVQRDGDPTAHAELIAIREAAARLGGRLTDCTMFVTLEPCAMCAGGAINAKLSRIVFGAFDPAAGCCGSVADITEHWFAHSIEIWSGVCLWECRQLLIDFFVLQRQRESRKG